MTKITVYKTSHGCARLFHGFVGSFAVVTDETSRLHKFFTVSPNWNYCGQNNGLLLPDAIDDGVELYSDKPYDDFVTAFENEYGKEARANDPNVITNNCADMVDFTLDHFFSESCCVDLFYKTYQSLCCFLCIGTCGLSCCPVPPCFNSPSDIFRKAKLLQCQYGKPHVAEVKAEEKELANKM